MDESLIEKQNGNFANTVLGAVPSVVYNEDCVEGLKRFSDNHFDLAIVDPPYGIDLGNNSDYFAYKGGVRGKKGLANDKKDWDKERPTDEYWNELFRVAKNQIIWGGNYFGLPAHRTFIVWDKMTYVPTMSQVEIAWTSFDSPARYVKINSNQLDRQHPTQKPVALYRWLLTNYAKPGDRILDTHGGSMSSAIACHDLGFDLDICELDPDYFKAGKERFERHVNRWAGLDLMIADTNDYSNLNTGLFAQQ